MLQPLDRLYPLKSTCLYVAVALLVDLWALMQQSFPPSDKALIWAGGGVFVYVPWGRPAVVISALFGLGLGVVIATAAHLLLQKHFSSHATQVAAGTWWGESALLAMWLTTAAFAYYLGNALLFPKLSGPLAAMNVFAARPIVYPALAAIYATAVKLQAADKADLDVEWRAAA